MADDFTSPREIAELNIVHFTGLLRTPLDEQTRKTVKRLLAEEQAKLVDFRPVTAPSSDDSTKHLDH
jgi:hypothetical protein